MYVYTLLYTRTCIHVNSINYILPAKGERKLWQHGARWLDCVLESKIPAISSYEDPVVCFLSKKEGAAAVGYNLKQRAQMGAWNMGPSGNSSALEHPTSLFIPGDPVTFSQAGLCCPTWISHRLGAWKRCSDLESGVILPSYLNLLFLSARSVLKVECHHEIDGNSPWDVGSLPPFGHVWGLVWLLQICQKNTVNYDRIASWESLLGYKFVQK